MLGEFREFLLKTNALALAIGVIIGAALGTVVTSLVEDIIMPPIGQLLGGVDFSQPAINLNQDGSAAIRYGEFLNAVTATVRHHRLRRLEPPGGDQVRACGSNVAA